MNEERPIAAASASIEVTIVIPAYNATQTLETTLASAAAQTVTRTEIVVVDDGSTDGTQELVRELADRDRRIRLIEQSNAGPSAARNRGMAMARAPIVALLDSDDVWTSDHLGRHLAALAADPRLGVSFSACAIVDRDLVPTGEVTRTFPRAVRFEDVLACNPAATCSSMVLRAEVFRQSGPMREDMAYAEDQEWLFRAIRTGWTVRGIDSHTVLYRTSPGGLSADVDRMRLGWLTFLEHARRLEPDIVGANEKHCLASMNLYWARRIQRSGQPGKASAAYLLQAIKASPMAVAANPVQLLATSAGCVAPRLAGAAIAAARKIRHA